MRPAVRKMTEKERLRFRKGDGVAIGAVILIAAVMLVFFLTGQKSDGPRVLQIYENGALIREMPLAQDGVYTVEGTYVNRIEIRDGRAAITESTCPGEDCVHSGWIKETGRSVVCLPNRVEIRIAGGEAAADVDAVVR